MDEFSTIGLGCTNTPSRGIDGKNNLRNTMALRNNGKIVPQTFFGPVNIHNENTFIFKYVLYNLGCLQANGYNKSLTTKSAANKCRFVEFIPIPIKQL